MLEAIFAPQSVTIVGGSPDPRKPGYRVLRNVVENGYGGNIDPIHPTASHMPNLLAYPSITAIPDALDFAVADQGAG